MSVTPIGLIIASISLVIFLSAPRYLVPWAIAVSVLQAASVLNFAGAFAIGVSPFFLVTILMSLRFAALWLSGRLSFRRDESLYLYLRPLLLLVLWGAFSAFALPRIFAGALVDSPRRGMDTLTTVPLEWTWSNIAQAGYLILDYVFVLYALMQCAESRQLERIIGAFRWSGAFAAAVGGYQFVAHFAHLPYPEKFFNSNLAWAQLIDQNIAGTWRISGTFTEPSAAGTYFAMWTTFLLFSTIGDKGRARSNWTLLAIGIVMLALTTSTTGYVAGAAVLALFLGEQVAELIVHGVVRRTVVLTLGSIVIALVVVILIFPDFRRVLSEVIWQKSQSRSSQDRSATSVRALYLVRQTVGLGVGLGSNRPSGLVFYILSDMGIPGLVLFLYLLEITRRLTRQAAARQVANGRLGSYIKACGWAFATAIFAAFIAGAEVTAPILWVSWGVLLAVCRHSYLSREPLIDNSAAIDNSFVYTAHAIDSEMSFGTANRGRVSGIVSNV